tara:strand:+ start:210 stop:563 length:354 start_codon:yes stop_codon:yes gene_type:complete
MKAEMLISGAIMLCAFTIPLTCVTSPPAMEASAAQKDTTVEVVPLPPVINEAPVVEYSEAIEKQPDCDVVIDSMQDKSSNIDDDMAEIKKDLEELKKRKKIKKVTKKKIKKKKVIDK